jgi:hypothetical protein
MLGIIKMFYVTAQHQMPHPGTLSGAWKIIAIDYCRFSLPHPPTFWLESNMVVSPEFVLTNCI